jgi:hypothetical protein
MSNDSVRQHDIGGVPMSSVKAKLTVILKADEVVVAETEDGALWQQVLVAINTGSLAALSSPSPLPSSPTSSRQGDGVAHHRPAPTDHAGSNSALEKLTQQIGIDVTVIQGACDPSTDEPYLHLNSHNWEAMRTALPTSGPAALASITVAATLLALWFRAAGLGNPTQAQAQLVLGTISQRDQNASRGITRASWLQTRPGGQVVLNPAEISKSVTLMKSFCSKDWSGWKGP